MSRLFRPILAASAILLATALSPAPPARAAGTLRIDFIDVGQGDAALITSPATLRRMGEAGRREARAYDWDAVLPRVLDIYSEAAEHRRAVRGGRGS